MPPPPQDCRGAPRPLWALPTCCFEVSPGTQHSALHAPGSPLRAVTRAPPTPCLASCLHTCGMHGNDSVSTKVGTPSLRSASAPHSSPTLWGGMERTASELREDGLQEHGPKGSGQPGLSGHPH